jgi:hypothetical protein
MIDLSELGAVPASRSEDGSEAGFQTTAKLSDLRSADTPLGSRDLLVERTGKESPASREKGGKSLL